MRSAAVFGLAEHGSGPAHPDLAADMEKIGEESAWSSGRRLGRNHGRSRGKREMRQSVREGDDGGLERERGSGGMGRLGDTRCTCSSSLL